MLMGTLSGAHLNRRRFITAAIAGAGLAIASAAAPATAGAAESANRFAEADAEPGLLLPSPPPGGIPLAQIFESNVTDKSVYDGRVYFVWSSAEPRYGDAIGCVYVPLFRDPDRAHDLAWYQQNHPTWVAYQADRVTPAYPYTYPDGNPMPLVVSNPEVREWWFDLYVQPWIDRGYPIIGFDNGHLYNAPVRRAGHYDEDGNWVQVFSGEVVDPVFIGMALDWLGYLRDRLHAAGVAMAANIGTPPSWLPRSQVLVEGIADAIDIVDVWVDEGGFTSARVQNVTDEAWDIKFGLVRAAVAKEVYVSINYPATRNLADASPEQLDWATANFLLAREQSSLLALRGQGDAGYFVDCPQLHVDLGVPAGPPAHDPSGAWTRPYANGFVIVNPSSTEPATVSLPAGAWWDTHGQTYGDTATLDGNRAIILQRGRKYPLPPGR